MLVLTLLLVDGCCSRHDILHLVVDVGIHVGAADDIWVVALWKGVVVALAVLVFGFLFLLWLDEAFLDLFRKGDLVGCDDVRSAASLHRPIRVQSGRYCPCRQRLRLTWQLSLFLFRLLLVLSLPWLLLLT